MGRPPCCDKANVKRGLWTTQEDAKILAYVANHGIGNWTQVPKKAGLNRCGKSCRLRWTNYLRPDLKHEEFTPHEEELIVQFHAAIGSRWSLIAKQLPGRTDNDVKNYWNTKLKKKLTKMGIDPITHKPISKILSDYESISSSCLTSTQPMRSLNNTFSNSLSSSHYEISSHIPHIPHILSRTHPNCLGVSDKESLGRYIFQEISPSSSTSSSSSVISNGNPTSASAIMPRWGEPCFGENVQTTEIIEEECNFQKFLEETQSEARVLEKTRISDSVRSSEMSEPSESPASSFVKELLDRDSEMRSDFPVFNDFLDY